MINFVSFDEEFVERLLKISGFNVGVLLGGHAEAHECLFLPVHIPRETYEDSNKIQTEYSKIEDINEKWVGSHCKNLNRMVPGGVHISGICIFMKFADFSKHQNHIRKSVFRDASYKIEPVFDRWTAFKTHIVLSLETDLSSDRKKEKIYQQLQAAVEPYLFSLASETHLLINGEALGGSEKLCGQSDVHKSLIIPTSDSKTKKSKHKKLAAEVDKSVEDVETKNRSWPKDGDLDKKAFSPLDVIIFGPQFPRWQRASSSSSLESGASSDTPPIGGNETVNSSSSSPVPINRLVVNGRIPGIAYLPNNSTVKDLLQALRKDLVRSVLARLQLLTNELHITSAELEVPRMALPQRVLVRFPACPGLPLSDYKFLSETSDDVITRLAYFCLPLGNAEAGDQAELVHMRSSSSARSSVTSGSTETIDSTSFPQIVSLRDRIDASCLDTSLEKSPELSADDEFSESELLDEAVETLPSTVRFSLSWSGSTMIAISVIVLVVSLIISYLYFGSSLHL